MACTVLKVQCIALIFRLQGSQKNSVTLLSVKKFHYKMLAIEYVALCSIFVTFIIRLQGHIKESFYSTLFRQ